MNTYTIYFQPRGELATWPLASDTLFGAVCWGIRILGLMNDQQLTEWLDNQKNTPKFAFSHAFPSFQKDKGWLRFYPRPANFHPLFGDFDTLALKWQQSKTLSLKAAKADVSSAGKKFKRLGYITESVFIDFVEGKLKGIDGLHSVLFENNDYSVKAGAMCTTAEAKLVPEKLFVAVAMQHNQIDRMAGGTVEGMLFYREETFFAPGTGLWALLRAEENDFNNYLQPALHFLSDTGFGADRTSGKGQFEITTQLSSILPRSQTPTAMMTLSHYLPISDELDIQGTPLAYTLKTLRPKREQRYLRVIAFNQKSTSVYKQALRVFEPGSIFPLKARKDIYGRLARLTPENQEPIYQSGAALMIYL